MLLFLSLSVIPFILNTVFPPVIWSPFSSVMLAVNVVIDPMLDFIGLIVIVVCIGFLFISSSIILFSVSISFSARVSCCVRLSVLSLRFLFSLSASSNSLFNSSIFLLSCSICLFLSLI